MEIRGVDDRGESPPPGVRVNARQCRVGIGDAKQIFEQQQIVMVDIWTPLPQSSPRIRIVETRYPMPGTQHVCDRMKRDLCGVGFAIAREDLDAAALSDRRDLAE